MDELESWLKDKGHGECFGEDKRKGNDMKRTPMLVALLLVSSTAMAQSVPCDQRISGGSAHDRATFCQFEYSDFIDAAFDYYERTGVYPLSSGSACLEQPLIEFRSFDLIERTCNQNPSTGRDLHSCGSRWASDNRYHITINYQAHNSSWSRWYRYIQLPQFFHECMGDPGEWLWSEVPREWA